MNIEQDNTASTTGGALFFFAILYIFIDYGRPQDIIPVIGYLRPALTTNIFLVILLVLNGDIWKAGSRQTKMVVLFNILIAAYIPFARNNMAALQTSMLMLTYVPFILAIIISVDTLGRLKRLINIIIVIMMYQSVYAILHGGVGAGNYFNDENDLALFINMWLPFCYFLFLHEKKPRMKIFYATGIIVGILAIIFSFSRGGFVGLVCMSVVLWWYSSKKVMTILIIIIAIFLVYAVGGTSYIDEMSTVTDTKESTAHERILTWKAAWAMFLDNPLGVGGNNFQKNFHRYQSKDFKRGMWGRVAHSLWFTLIPELGIFGIIIYYYLLKYNLKDIFFLKSISHKKEEVGEYIHAISLAYLASLVGFFASATFLSVLYYAHYWYLTGMIVATVSVAKSLYLNQDVGLITDAR